MKHLNSGRCLRCLEIINTFPDFDPELRDWFTRIQSMYLPELHVSEAGRGRAKQELCFKNKTSKAHYGQSAHNYNCGLDLFEMGGDDIKNIYEEKWFNEKLAPLLVGEVEWYGRPGSKFRELPHVERADWRERVKAGKVKLVE